MPVKKISVSFDFPFSPIKLSADWEPSDQERQAAWEMYVELATRVTVVELPGDRGLVREALTSYYSLFATTREILRKYGPDVARPKRDSEISLGQLAVVNPQRAAAPVAGRLAPGSRGLGITSSDGDVTDRARKIVAAARRAPLRHVEHPCRTRAIRRLPRRCRRRSRAYSASFERLGRPRRMTRLDIAPVTDSVAPQPTRDGGW